MLNVATLGIITFIRPSIYLRDINVKSLCGVNSCESLTTIWARIHVSMCVWFWRYLRIWFFILYCDVRLFAVAISHQTVTHSGILLTLFLYLRLTTSFFYLLFLTFHLLLLCCSYIRTYFCCWQHRQHQQTSVCELCRQYVQVGMRVT